MVPDPLLQEQRLAPCFLSTQIQPKWKKMRQKTRWMSLRCSCWRRLSAYPWHCSPKSPPPPPPWWIWPCCCPWNGVPTSTHSTWPLPVQMARICTLLMTTLRLALWTTQVPSHPRFHRHPMTAFHPRSEGSHACFRLLWRPSWLDASVHGIVADEAGRRGASVRGAQLRKSGFGAALSLIPFLAFLPVLVIVLPCRVDIYPVNVIVRLLCGRCWLILCVFCPMSSPVCVIFHRVNVCVCVCALVIMCDFC